MKGKLQKNKIHWVNGVQFFLTFSLLFYVFLLISFPLSHLCCARGDNNLFEESAHLAETWCSRRSNQHDKNNEQHRKVINTIFNEVRQRAYVLGARERDFIDSTINTN